MEASNRAWDIAERKIARMTGRIEKEYARSQEKAEEATAKVGRMERLLSIPGLDEGQKAAIVDRVNRGKEITGGMVGLDDPQIAILRELTARSKEQGARMKAETAGRTIDKEIQKVDEELALYEKQDRLGPDWLTGSRFMYTGFKEAEKVTDERLGVFKNLQRRKLSLERARIKNQLSQGYITPEDANAELAALRGQSAVTKSAAMQELESMERSVRQQLFQNKGRIEQTPTSTNQVTSSPIIDKSYLPKQPKPELPVPTPEELRAIGTKQAFELGVQLGYWQ